MSENISTNPDTPDDTDTDIDLEGPITVITNTTAIFLICLGGCGIIGIILLVAAIVLIAKRKKPKPAKI